MEAKLIMVGGCRHKEDEERLEGLRFGSAPLPMSAVCLHAFPRTDEVARAARFF